MIIRKGLNAAVLTTSPKQKPLSLNERIYTLPTLVSRHPVYLATPIFNRIRNVISIEKPDIVHIQNLSPVSLVVLSIVKRFGIPVVAGIHDLPRNISVYSPVARGLVNKIAQRLLVYFFNRATVSVAPSNYAKCYYEHHGVRNVIRVISNGIDLNRFYPSNERSQDFEKRYLLDTDLNLPRAMFVGRIMPDKDLEVLIKATRDLEIVLIVIGYAWPKYFRKLQALASPTTIFIGQIPSSYLASAYNSADLFIQPSTTELQSLVTLEAMASGLPIIGVNSGPIPELVVDGVNGYLFEPSNSEDLRRKIKLILKNEELRKIMKSESIRIAEKHSLEDTADQYIELYKKVLVQKDN